MQVLERWLFKFIESETFDKKIEALLSNYLAHYENQDLQEQPYSNYN